MSAAKRRQPSLKGEEDSNKDFSLSPLAVELAAQGHFNLFGDIESALVDQAVLFLQTVKERATFRIFSYGGDADSARALVGAMEMAKGEGVKIQTVALGSVFSAALDIFIAGSPGLRFVQQDCLLMAHACLGPSDSKKEHKLRTALDVAILKRYSKIPPPLLKTILENGSWYFSAREGVALGLGDKVIRVNSDSS